MFEVTLYAFNRKVKSKVQQEFTYYDFEAKKIVTKTGGRLFYRYDYKKKKSIPEVQELEGMVEKNSWDDILNWTKNNRFNVRIKNIIQGKHLVFDIDDYSWNKAQNELKKLSIYFTSEEIDAED